MNIERMIDRIEPMSTQLHIDRLQTKRSQVFKKTAGEGGGLGGYCILSLC